MTMTSDGNPRAPGHAPGLVLLGDNATSKKHIMGASLVAGDEVDGVADADRPDAERDPKRWRAKRAGTESCELRSGSAAR